MITFAELDTICHQNGLDYGAAESHGILTGLLCSTHNLELQDWLALLQDDQARIDYDENIWGQVFQSTLSQLSGDDMDFQLLLPDDEWPLNQRTESLANWCSGFLFGVSSTNLQQQLTASEHIKEVIEDLSQIAKASYDDSDETDDDESAYMELAEYIRAAAMLVYIEFQPPAPSNDITLH